MNAKEEYWQFRDVENHFNNIQAGIRNRASTWLLAAYTAIAVLLKVSETSASCWGFLFFVPLKIIPSIFSVRMARVFCSPSTQRMASTTFDLPQPFGPTIPVIPSSKFMTILSPKLLNPFISSFDNNIRRESNLNIQANKFKFIF